MKKEMTFSNKLQQAAKKHNVNLINFLADMAIYSMALYCSKEASIMTFKRTHTAILAQHGVELVLELFYKKSEEYKSDLRAMNMAYAQEVQKRTPFEDIFFGIIDPHLSSTMGQHFTPPELADLLSMINIELNPDKQELSISEPTCGSGALALGALRVINEKEGAAGVAEVNIEINDLDTRMVLIAAMQVLHNCVLHNLKVNKLLVANYDVISEIDNKKFLMIFTSLAEIEKQGLQDHIQCEEHQKVA